MHTFIIQHVSCAFKVYGGKRTIFNILAVHSKYVVDRARLEIKISHFIPPSHRDKSSRGGGLLLLPRTNPEEVHPFTPSDGSGGRSLGTRVPQLIYSLGI